jgi:hypothetical protein
MNYNTLDARFRKGSTLAREEVSQICKYRKFARRAIDLRRAYRPQE